MSIKKFNEPNFLKTMTLISNIIKTIFGSSETTPKNSNITTPPIESKNSTIHKIRKTSFHTKSEKVRQHLLQHGQITTWEAIQLYKATRLSAIIFNLRKRNYQIESIAHSSYDLNSGVCNYCTYKLIETNESFSSN